jgi:hypothetical protein
VPVTIVDDRSCISVLGPEELRRDVECIGEVRAVANPESGAVEVHETPL